MASGDVFRDVGSGFTIPRSRPVKTPTTPGSVAAAFVSMLRMRACAWGLRTSRAWTMPGSERSAAKRVRPVTFSAPSMRRSGRPIAEVVDMRPRYHASEGVARG
jgi:hypothetical protein